MLITLLTALAFSAEPTVIHPLPVPTFVPGRTALPALPDLTESLTGEQATTYQAWIADPTDAHFEAAETQMHHLLDFGGAGVMLAWANLQNARAETELLAAIEANKNDTLGPQTTCEGLSGGTAKACDKWQADPTHGPSFLSKLDKGSAKLDANGRFLRASLSMDADTDLSVVVSRYKEVQGQPGTEQHSWSCIVLSILENGEAPEAAVAQLQACEQLTPTARAAAAVIGESMGGPRAIPDLAGVLEALETALTRASSPMEQATILVGIASLQVEASLPAVKTLADAEEPAEVCGFANLTMATMGDDPAGRFARAERLGAPDVAGVARLGLGWLAVQNGGHEKARTYAEASEDSPKQAAALLAWVQLAEGSGWPNAKPAPTRPLSDKANQAYADLWKHEGPTLQEDAGQTPNAPHIAQVCAARARLLSPSLAGTVSVMWDGDEAVGITPKLRPADALGATDLPACLALWLPTGDAPPYAFQIQLEL